MTKPLVSICLPNLNTRPFLDERMETVMSQTLKDWELIISDNYSDDGAWELFQTFRSDARVQLYRTPRRGMYANWNECIRRARGEYVYIATSDDSMRPECLEKLASALESRRDLDLALCDFEEIDERGVPCRDQPRPQRAFLGEWLTRGSIRKGTTEFLLHAAFGTTVWVTMTTVLIRRSLFEKTGLFRTDAGSHADEEWTLRACLASDIVYVPRRYATWRIHPAQATSKADPRRTRGLILRSARSVVYDRRSGIPSAWKRVPQWDRQLLAVYRRRFLECLEIDRWSARMRPRRFVRDVLEAVRRDPGVLSAKVRADDGRSRREPIDHRQVAQDLIGTFGGQWPPVEAVVEERGASEQLAWT